MSIRVSGVYLVPAATNNEAINNEKMNAKFITAGNNENNHHLHHQGKSVTIVTGTGGVVGPQRSNSLDYLNFEEKRQIIASSLSLSDFLAHGPAAAAAAAAKEVAANAVIGKIKKFVCCWEINIL